MGNERDKEKAHELIRQLLMIGSQAPGSTHPTLFDYPATRWQLQAPLRLGRVDNGQYDALALGRLLGCILRVPLVGIRQRHGLPGRLPHGLGHSPDLIPILHFGQGYMDRHSCPDR